MKKISMICSGYGRGIINIIKNKSEINHEIKLVICPDLSKELIKIANLNKISVETLEQNLNLNKKNIKVNKLLNLYDIDYVFLVGCLFKISDKIINDYERKIINIHPSLLQAFKGLNAIEQAMDYGTKISGITTHFIDKEIDCGEIIDQYPIRIDSLNFEQIDKLYVRESLKISIKTLNSLPK